jgi:hypothetical protein
VRRSPLYEVVGQLGMWGVIINGVQASITEHNKMRTVNGVVATVCRFAVELGLRAHARFTTVGVLIAYTAGAGIAAFWTPTY